MASLNILFEDNHVIAVYKSANMLVQGDATGDENLMDIVKKYLKEKNNKPGNVFLGLVHRLDRPVQGIVIFGKTSKGAARLSEQFRAHTVKKIYTAVVTGKPAPAATLVHYLLKNETTNTVTVFDTPHPGALRAELSYSVIEQGKKSALVRIELKTGRPHQIRAQFSRIGHPLVGDTKYGGSPAPQLHLAATELHFDAATTQERHMLTVPAPFVMK